LAGLIFISKKIQNGIILVKKQKSTGYNRVFDQVLLGQPGHKIIIFFIFLLIRPGFSIRLTESPINLPGGIGFKTIVESTI